MKANGVDVYLIPVGDPHASEYMPDHYTALTYFSGFHGENSNFVVTNDRERCLADGRYFVQAEKEIAGTEIQLMRMGEPGVPTAEQYCGKVLPEGGKLGLCGLTAPAVWCAACRKSWTQERHHQAAEPRGRAVDGGPSRPARHPGMAPAERVRRLLPLPRSWASCVRSSLSWAAPHSWWASWTIWHGCSICVRWTFNAPLMQWLTAM